MWQRQGRPAVLYRSQSPLVKISCAHNFWTEIGKLKKNVESVVFMPGNKRRVKEKREQKELG